MTNKIHRWRVIPALLRWPNLVLIFLSLSYVTIHIHSSLICSGTFIILTLSTVLITASGYIINDIYDYKTDLINKPEKLWIGTFISPKEAILFYLILTTLSLIFLYFLPNPLIVGVQLFSIFCLWLYSYLLKKTIFWGNFLVSFLISTALIQPYILYQEPLGFNLLLYVSQAFLINLMREIVKDREDLRGDKINKINTLATILPVKSLKRLFYSLLSFAFALYLLGWYSSPHIWLNLYSLFLIIPVNMVLLSKIYKYNSKEDLSELSKWLKIYMLISIHWILFF
jgi:4-hydroxybenzoate polyprenyltransferase